MKKLIFLLTIAVMLMKINPSLSAQEQTVGGRFFYAELLGPGVIVSANIDSRFKSNSRLGLGYRLGVGFGVEKFEDRLVESLKNDDFTPYIFTGFHLIYATANAFADSFNKNKKAFFSIPAGLNYIFGKPNSASTFEFGAGVSLLTHKVSLYNYELDKRGHMIGYFSLMYRLMPVNSDLSLRIGITPIIGTAGDLYPTGAVSFGYAF